MSDTKRTDLYLKHEEKIYEHLSIMSREPFKDSLHRIMCSEPDKKELEAFANKAPDRWGQLVTMMARLAGYNEKVEVDANVQSVLAVRSYSDAQLMSAIKDLENQLGNTIEGVLTYENTPDVIPDSQD